jgi:hypothetical protein
MSKEQNTIDAFNIRATEDEMVQFALQKGAEVSSMPICPHCERLGIKTKQWAHNRYEMICLACGYKGETDYVYTTYMKDKMYK